MSNEYWSIIVDAICDDTGLEFDAAQTAKTIKILDRAHSDYGDQHGHREADKSVRRMNDDEAREPLFRFIEEQMAKLDDGPNFFNQLSRRQKEGLACLTQAKRDFARNVRS